ncbi:ATP-binding cassette domain-containing protein [Mesorhizobium sp. B1-1-4]|uniref:ATP-binding cassette domain-containing protein n=1 Tax=Mesorhizobium sp. B1-1-4 TaxID=2589980 RepID=UPI00112AA6F5|nr:ATP-binding cassette domain-containing protein [Mesorhizobium sp. B1-1-4]TPN59650.1 ATP-binding cassette domain-containing protein [Mesorhizobium sp. B1-1-4]
MSHYTVTNTVPKGPKKQLSVTEGKKSTIFLSVPRFACVGKGDLIAIDASHPQNVFCQSSESPDDLIRIAPHFERSESATVGALDFAIQITEVNKQEDIESLGFLEQFHYKSIVADDEQDDFLGRRTKAVAVGGRRGILLLYLRVSGAWLAAGYIELQMPLMMCKPRHDLFSNPFAHGTRPIHWAKWDQHAIKKYVNAIVRIARIVVHPDYRGLGLSRLLISAAKEFCSARWHIGGRRPLFMEISAEMLNYVDFVSSSGFKFVGRTEGNASRIISDLIAMRRGYDVSSGIMSLQKKYLSVIEEYSRSTGITVDEALTRLQSILAMEEPAEALTASEWAAFRKVVRQPIPYYLCGLDKDAQNYLQTHIPSAAPHASKQPFRVSSAAVDLKMLSVRSSFMVPQTKNVRMITSAFGLSGERVDALIVPPMSIKASAGNIVFVVGVSGSGKSALLKAIDPETSLRGGTLEVRFQGNRSYSAGWLVPLPEDVPIFDYFAGRYSPENAFTALSKVGLSEAFALIKPFRMLSRGQQYRAMLADLLLRQEQVWLLDEFCADLDPITARIVAHSFRRHVMSSGRIAFVVAANHAHYIDALRPTHVLRLRTGADAKLTSYKEYRDELLDKVC